MVEKGIGCLEGEESVVIHVKKSLHNGIEVDASRKRPAVVVAITEIVGNVQTLQLVTERDDIFILTDRSCRAVDVSVSGIPAGTEQRMLPNSIHST